MKLSQYALPKVSIIIPTKNRCSLLQEAIDSVRQQTYGHWEAIVIDDGSTDGTSERMRLLSEQEPRLHFFRREGNQSGAPVCRNQGLAIATGDYVVFLDSDDSLAPFCLEQRVKAMQTDPTLDFAVFPCQLFREKPGDVALLWNADTQASDIDRLLHLHDVPWQTTSPIWKQQALKHLGTWDESLLRWQDWEFHLRAVINGLKYKKFTEPDCFWRVSTPVRETVGSNWSPEDVRCLEQLLSKAHGMLQRAGLLNIYRQRLLAGLHFWVANQWVVLNQNQEAVRVWTSCREEALIGVLEYWEGVVCFKAQNVNLVRRMVRKYLRVRWDKELLLRRSNTFQNTPLSSQVFNHKQFHQNELTVQISSQAQLNAR